MASSVRVPAASFYPPPAISSPADPSGKEKELPSILAAISKTKPDGTERKEVERAVAVREVAEGWFKAHRQWSVQAIKCREMIAGNQWGIDDDRLGWIAKPEFTDDRTRVTKNKLSPSIQQMVAMLSRDAPQLKIMAQKTEIADTASSEFGTKVATHIQLQHRTTQTFRHNCDEVSKVGETWLLLQWREDRGPWGKVGEKMVSDPATMFGPDGKVAQEPEFEDVNGLQGDIEFRVVPGEMVATEPGTTMPGGIDGLAICMRETISEGTFRDRFPKKWKEIQTKSPESAEADIAALRRADRSSVLGNGVFGTSTGYAHKEAQLYTFWGRRTEGYPNGWMICVAGDVVCAWEERNERYSLPDEPPDLPPRIPFPLLQAIADPYITSSRGRSRVLDAITHQQEINELASKQLDHYALTSNTKIRMPAGLSTEWTDGIGQVIRVPRMHEGAQIGYLIPPPVPDYQSAIRAADADLKEALGINDSSNGEVPFSNTSGRAMDKAQQKDETRLNPIKTSLFDMWAEAIRFALQLYRRYATYERMLLVAGDGEDTDLEFFKGAQLVSVIDVIAFNDQMLPVDPTARHLAISNTFQTLAAIPDEKLRTEAARLFRLQNDGAFLDEINPHDVKSEDNNRDLMANEPVEFAEWDDHLVHKAALERLMCTKSWRKRVKDEAADPKFAQIDPMSGMQIPPSSANSPLYQATMALWQQHADAMQQAPPPPGMPGAPAAPGAAPPIPGPGAPGVMPQIGAAA